jgi:hypothetical protein
MAHKQPTDVELQGSSRTARVLVWLAASAPILALLVPGPEHLDLGNWFGRAGAVTTVFALLAGSVLIRAKLWLSPPGLGWVGLEEQRDKFLPKYEEIERYAFVLTIIGTVIWAYGDIPFTWFTEWVRATCATELTK